MSILSDLDPKNARFDDNTGHTGAGKMSWTAPLALFTVAGLGLAVAVYQGGSEKTATAKAVIPPVANNVVAPRVSTPSAPITPSVEQKPVAIESTSVGATAADAKPQILPAQPPQKQVAANKQPQKQARKTQPEKKKLASSKNTNKNPQQQDKTLKTANSKDSRKPARRDVEIITAIVK